MLLSKDIWTAFKGGSGPLFLWLYLNYGSLYGASDQAPLRICHWKKIQPVSKCPYHADPLHCGCTWGYSPAPECECSFKNMWLFRDTGCACGWGAKQIYNQSGCVAGILSELRKRLKISSLDWKLKEHERAVILLNWLRQSIKMADSIEKKFHKEYWSTF